ncbi:MAG TPA: DUF378 domain-containing protein [Candidatus Omnitrophica bacterium]|nr:MAG: hypothetical protein A2Y05_03000 [Omnitrophica WOR_2 bacterium GWA2_53_43]HBO98210.1 DUF378 domain-containing protein [Candidatus Omnitrophota bacterium]HCI44774.1 DUF378 domain-containing protein [Candidatus Omnitrophota bacterium]
MGKQGCVVCNIAGILVIIGALNWGLVGALQLNLVDQIFGAGSGLSRVIYVLVGLAGIMKLASCFKECPCCKKS